MYDMDILQVMEMVAGDAVTRFNWWIRWIQNRWTAEARFAAHESWKLYTEKKTDHFTRVVIGKDRRRR